MTAKPIPRDNNNRRKEDDVEHWHLDKKVPMAIIFAIILQTIYFTVFLTKLDSRVGVNEGKIAEMSDAYKDIVEIRVHQEYMAKQLDDLEDFLKDDVEWVKPKKTKGTR